MSDPIPANSNSNPIQGSISIVRGIRTSSAWESHKVESNPKEYAVIGSLKHDSQFYISKMDAHQVGFFTSKSKWLEVKNGPKPTDKVYLKVSDLEKRYLLSKEQITKLRSDAKSGDLTILNEQAAKLNEAMNKYHQFKSPQHMNIPRTLLAKISLISAGLGKTSQNLEEGVSLTHDNKEFMAKLTNGRLHIFHIDLAAKNILGHGGFGTAYKVHDIATGNFFAMKLAHKEMGDLKAESMNLSAIEKAGISKAQRPPVLYNIIKVGGKSREVMISDLYQIRETGVSNLGILIAESWIKKGKPLTSKTSINACKQLMHQYLQILKSQFYHGDIKTQNIFVSNQESREPEFVIGDWGSAKILDENFKHTGVGSTITYLPKALLEQMQKGSQIAAKCHDRFCIGMVLSEALVGRCIYDYDFKKGHKIDYHAQGELYESFNKKVNDFIYKLANPNPPKDKEEFDRQNQEIEKLWNELLDMKDWTKKT